MLLGHRVNRLTQNAPARRSDSRHRFTVHTSQGPLRATQVVIATGAFQRPHVPRVATELGERIVQVHSAQYRNPGQLPAGTVLVVGGGNSGLQIAEELAHSRAPGDVHLAVGSTPAQIPQRILGRDLFWWLTRTGAISRPGTSVLGRRFRARLDLVIGTSANRVAAAGDRVRPRLTGATGDDVTFADGAALAPSGVVWATGYVPDYTWIDIPGVVTAFPKPGTVVHRCGVADVPGLFFLGLPWQHSRGSALLGFVRHDAEWLAGRMLSETMSAGAARGGSA